MAPRKNVVHFLFGYQIPAGSQRTVIQERDGVFAVLVFQPEQVAHGLNGKKNARIGAIIAVLPHLAEHANNLKAYTVEQDGRTHRWAAGKYVFQKLPADYGHASRFAVVLLIEPATRAHRDGSNLVIFRRDPKNLAIGGTILTDRPNVLAVEHRRKILERASLTANGEIIPISEMVGAP